MKLYSTPRKSNPPRRALVRSATTTTFYSSTRELINSSPSEATPPYVIPCIEGTEAQLLLGYGSV
ncbi:2183_t:CDS:2 [Entrophospora sp. SA101]|nr:2183_t:CDS:2 [Entrophospora sp. SA101]